MAATSVSMDSIPEHYNENVYSQEDPEIRSAAFVFPAWLISIVFHIILLILCAGIFFTLPQKAEKDVIISSDLVEEEEEEEKPEVERKIVKVKVDVQVEVVVPETVVITEEDVAQDHMETENEMEAETAEGAEDAVSDLPLSGSGLIGHIGGGGGGGGSFGQRFGGGKKRALVRYGGNKETESALSGALEWLKRHQEPDGHWDSRKYGALQLDRSFDDGISALALLAFLGAGHTPRIGKYKVTVRRAIDWLLSRQGADGSFNLGGRGGQPIVYNSGIAVLALAEACAMNPESKLKKAVQIGVDFIVKIQDKETGGWFHAGHNSTSVLGWMVMAIKSARIAGIDVPDETFKLAQKRLEEMTEKQGGYMTRIAYERRGNALRFRGPTMTAVGMLGYQYLGFKKADLTSLGDALLKIIPGSGGRVDYYKWYYGTLALFQMGGQHWESWNKGMQKTYLALQRKGGPRDGSLQDVDGSYDPTSMWGSRGGRVYTTALAALTMEIYYRYKSIYD